MNKHSFEYIDRECAYEHDRPVTHFVILARCIWAVADGRVDPQDAADYIYEKLGIQNTDTYNAGT